MERIRADAPRTRVLVLSAHDDATTISAAFGAGALGYVVKTGEMGELADALRTVWSGRQATSADAAEALRRHAARADATRPFPQLTTTEYRILDLLAQGLTNTDIAGDLHVAPHTVGNACTRIYEKLGVTRRTEAALAAHRAGVGL